MVSSLFTKQKVISLQIKDSSWCGIRNFEKNKHHRKILDTQLHIIKTLNRDLKYYRESLQICLIKIVFDLKIEDWVIRLV